MVNVSWCAQTTEFPCAYKNIDAVALHAMKLELISAGMLELISANVGSLDGVFEECPELIDTDRCRES
jgi:hypothetical protein